MSDDNELTEEERERIEEEAMEAGYTGEEEPVRSDAGADAESERDSGQHQTGQETSEPGEGGQQGEDAGDGQSAGSGTDEQSAAESAAESESSSESETAAQPSEPDDRDQRIQQLEQQLERVNGTVRGLQGYVKKLSRSAEEQASQQGADSPSRKQVDEAVQDAEKWKELKDEFPEWGEAMESQMQVMQARIKKDIPDFDPDQFQETVSQQVNEMAGSLREELRSELRAEMASEAVEERHPGWQQTVKSESFQKWLGEQPQETQALASSERAGDAINLLDKYNEQDQSGQRKSESQQRLENSVAPTDGGARGGGGEKPLSEDEAMELAYRGEI